MEHSDKIQEQFSKQARIFSQQPSIENLDHTQWMLNLISLKSDDKVLGVAAGTGSFSRALAPLVKTVTALDLTPSMLEQGRLETIQAGLTNIQFEQGTAENLPYPQFFFDVVVTRFSLHHFEVPMKALYEMKRVLKTGGQITVIDLVSPEDVELALTYNQQAYWIFAAIMS